MKPPSKLNGSQLRTYERIFQHPVSHNLGWHDVLGMLRQLGTVDGEPNGNIKVTRNGQSIILPSPRTKDVAKTDEVIALRHFLEKTESAAPWAEVAETNWLVVIDHHEARLFRSQMSGAEPQQILPHEPEHFFRHAHNSKDFSRGQEKPDPNSFFEPVARALLGAAKILIFGTGTGTSSEMDQFAAWLKQHHPVLAGRVIGSVVVDEHHMSQGQLLQKAREYYSNLHPALP